MFWKRLFRDFEGMSAPRDEREIYLGDQASPPLSTATMSPRKRYAPASQEAVLAAARSIA